MTRFDFNALDRVNDKAEACSADIRALPEYFHVDEILPFEPDGSGGHVWLKIKKRGINTDWLANELAKFSGVKSVAVGYAGLKDRHAVTRQWFSINLEGFDEPNWSEFENDDIQIVEQTRHGKKLKRGVLAGNRFKLRLTNIVGEQALWQASLKQVKECGVPNYFGEQRFGHQMANLDRVEHWFSSGNAPRKRNQKSIYLSAGRSWLFNLVLAQRIKQGCWNKAILGDMMLLSGTKASLFLVEQVDEVLTTRVSTMDIHPTGVLWGQGNAKNTADSVALENLVLSDWADWKEGLEQAGLERAQRALRLFPADFSWLFLDDRQLEIEFSLPAGSYATSVLRELANCTNVSRGLQ